MDENYGNNGTYGSSNPDISNNQTGQGEAAGSQGNPVYQSGLNGQYGQEANAQYSGTQYNNVQNSNASYNNGQYNNVQNSNAPYNNGQYNNVQNGNAQYNNAQYNNTQYNNTQNSGYQDYTSGTQYNNYQDYTTGGPYGQYQTPINNGGNTSPSGVQVASLVCGILAICFCCCYGIPSVILGIAGLICGIMGNKQSRTNVGTAGLICSIVGLILGIVSTIYYGFVIWAMMEGVLDDIYY